MNDMSNGTMGMGIANAKKGKLDSLTMQVTETQYEVDQYQAIINAETEKSVQFNAFLTEADANKSTALANLNLVKGIDFSVNSLVKSTKLAMEQSGTAAKKISQVSGDMSTLVDKLIFSVELIVRFDQLVNKQKASNPLIPDTLISFMSKAVTDANNAVALTLAALESCYAAEATALRSKSVINLENDQVIELEDKIENIAPESSSLPMDGIYHVGLTVESTGVLPLSIQAYNKANDKYKQALVDNNMVNQQLAHAKTLLATATTSLSSYKAGLAAATAAAYAA